MYIHDPQVSESKISQVLGENKSNSNEGQWFYNKDLELNFKNADAIVILTEWDEYLEINWEHTYKIMKRPSWLFDTRGIINNKDLKNTQFNFWKVGKGFIDILSR